MKRFLRLQKLISFNIILLLLAACSGTADEAATVTPATPAAAAAVNTPTLAATVTLPATAAATPTFSATATVTEAAPATATATATPQPTATPIDMPVQLVDLDGYIDDRSDPVALLASYFNAINRREYVRAYAYWRDTSQVGDYESFAAGFATTESVSVTVGGISGTLNDLGEHILLVAVVLRAEMNDGTAPQHFAGCYHIVWTPPEAQSVPPYVPLNIASATVDAVAPDADTITLLAAACGVVGEVLPLPAADHPLDVGPHLFIDDRSTPVQLLRSYYNAVNRQEYVRAYAYWEENSLVGPYADFAAGFSEAESVTIDIGDIFSGVAAGNIFYDVPVSLQVTTIGGDRQFFAGCYRLHLANPANYGAPPFRSMAIRAANMQAVADVAAAKLVIDAGCGPD